MAELRELSPTTSAECVSPDAGTRVLPELRLDAVLGPRFDLMDFIESKPATKCNSSPETLSPAQGSSAAPASSKSSTLTVVREAEKKEQGEAACDPGPQDCESSPDGQGCPTGMSGQCHTKSLDMPATIHADHRFRNRSHSEKLHSTPARSKQSSSDHGNELAENVAELTRLRANSTPEIPEMFSGNLFSSRQPSTSSHVSLSASENVPSVSELVSKFRRMGSLPGAFPASTQSESLQLPRGIRKTSRENQFDIYRSRFSNDSEDDSALFSNPGEMADERQQVVIRGVVSAAQGDS